MYLNQFSQYFYHSLKRVALPVIWLPLFLVTLMSSDRLLHNVSLLRERMISFLQTEYNAHGLEDLSPAHGSLLYAVQEDRPTMQELAQRLGRDNSTVTALAAHLERLKYLKRERNPQDRRVFQVSLTAKGEKARRLGISLSRRMIARAYKGLPASERRELNRLLGKSIQNF